MTIDKSAQPTQPAPADREALVVAIGQASDPPLTYEACERLADALIADGWRKPTDAQPEVLGWAVVRKDGTVRHSTLAWDYDGAVRHEGREEETMRVRVSIQVADDEEGENK